MEDDLKIAEHIYNHTMFGNGCRFSSFGALEDFFAPVPTKEQGCWPYDFSSAGMKTTYFNAEFFSEQLGFDQKLDIRFSAVSEKDRYTARAVWSFDDERLTISLESLSRDTESGGADFAGLFLARQQNFLTQYDDSRRLNKTDSPSEILVHADSNLGRKTCGGYVWAVRGFDFANSQELAGARRNFQAFAARSGVLLTEKDLKNFVKPCHFAAFRCAAANKMQNLGKAFLLNYSWRGVWNTKNPQAEEKRFAAVYSAEGDPSRRMSKAAAELNPRYLKMLQNFNRTQQSGMPRDILSACKRFTAAKLAALKIYSK